MSLVQCRGNCKGGERPPSEIEKEKKEKAKKEKATKQKSASSSDSAQFGTSMDEKNSPRKGLRRQPVIEVPPFPGSSTATGVKRKKPDDTFKVIRPPARSSNMGGDTIIYKPRGRQCSTLPIPPPAQLPTEQFDVVEPFTTSPLFTNSSLPLE